MSKRLIDEQFIKAWPEIRKAMSTSAMTIPRVNRGYEEQTEAQEGEARTAYEAAPKPKVEICQECNSPIIDGNPAGHRVGCESNQDIKF